MAQLPAAVVVKTWRCFGGRLTRWKHESLALSCTMHFHVYEPPQASADAPAPVMYFLSGLTCTDENFPTKSGAQRAAAEHGIALVMPDTSPRGTPLDTLSTSWDFGAGAGFYVDATASPWSQHYRMATYVREELPAVLRAAVSAGLLSLDVSRASISGHSMGGLGALSLALSSPVAYRAVSALAPIAHPSHPACAWGQKALRGYLGEDVSTWAAVDPTALARAYTGPHLHILVDQGEEDDFLAAGQLRGEEFAAAAGAAGCPLTVTYTLRPGYDHSFYFVSSFIGAHIAHHAAALKA